MPHVEQVITNELMTEKSACIYISFYLQQLKQISK